MVSGALQQLLGQTLWEDMDYLVVDMPPGTGDIQLTLAQRVPVAGAVIVTTPQDIALHGCPKGIEMFRKVDSAGAGRGREHVRLHVCPECGHESAIFGAGGGERIAAEFATPLLGRLPLTMDIREQADGGTPTVVNGPGRRHRRALPRRAPGTGRPSCGACPALPLTGSAVEISMTDDRRGPQHDHQIRPVDPPDGRRARHDRAVRAWAGALPRRIPADLLRHLQLRLRRPLRRRVQDIHQHQLSHRRSETVRRTLFVELSGATSASFPPTSFALARTVEYFRMPRDVLDSVPGKEHVCTVRHHRQRNPAGARMGRATSPWNSPTPRRCRRRSTPTKAWHR